MRFVILSGYSGRNKGDVAIALGIVQAISHSCPIAKVALASSIPDAHVTTSRT